jgi:hypothetical protein
MNPLTSRFFFFFCGWNVNNQNLSLSSPNINGPECEGNEFLGSKHKHLKLLGHKI